MKINTKLCSPPANPGPPAAANGHISYEDIAFAAYCLWEQERRPDGRDLAHWFRAEELLRKAHSQATANKPGCE